MIFRPKNTVMKEGSFAFSGEVTAYANSCFDKDIIRELWHNFTFHSSTLNVSAADDFVFRIGDAEKPCLNGHAYGINVEKTGVCIAAENEKDLLLGFMTMIDRIEAVDAEDGSTVLEIKCCTVLESPAIGVRMAHFCVFPETELWELHKFIRFCSVLRYSHVIVEFWGMYQYDCMKELAWQGAYTKEELVPIFREANDMGLEIVPMFNHWGHAAAARVMHGKHVVLDQNPSLETYFSENGWCWDIRKPKVRKLLAKVRRELIELCGPGSYFHIGCDEAYGFDLESEEGRNAVCDFINEVADDLETFGRRAFIWGDMFLWYNPDFNRNNGYTALNPSMESQNYMLNRLSKKVIIADWQYSASNVPVETSEVFVKAGFDCVICPWDNTAVIAACIETAKQKGLYGYIHTTWNTLSLGMPAVANSAVGFFEDDTTLPPNGPAAALRKAYFVNGDQRKAGWAKHEIGVIT